MVFDSVSYAFGMEMAELKDKYYFDDLAAFIDGEKTECGKIYFVELKPLFDKYGYELVKREIIKLRNKEKTNE